jgi:hypothetical protein
VSPDPVAGTVAGTAASAKAGLAQALAVGGGAQGPLGAAARHAYTAGLEEAMAVGAGCVAVAAVAVFLALRAPAAAPPREQAPAGEQATASRPAGH